MATGYEYRFVIDAFTRDTLPMARLAEYMADLAVMLGEPESVHFIRVDEGSAVLVQQVDEPAVPKVRARTGLLRSGDAPPPMPCRRIAAPTIGSDRTMRLE